jgi:hypothetical protein
MLHHWLAARERRAKLNEMEGGGVEDGHARGEGETKGRGKMAIKNCRHGGCHLLKNCIVRREAGGQQEKAEGKEGGNGERRRTRGKKRGRRSAEEKTNELTV